MRASAKSLLVMAVIAATCAQAGDVWRWKDAQGVVHYSDVPVQGAVRVKQNVSSSASSAGQSQGTTAGQSGPVLTPQGVALADEQRQQQAAGKAVLQDIAKKRAEQCKTATAQYEQLISSTRIYREEKGERTYLSAKELEEARVRVRQERDAVCGPASR
jgi:hypothetical protein